MNFIAVFDSIQKTGGASYNVHTSDLNPSFGYMVATTGFERTFAIPETLNHFQDTVISYMVNKHVWNKFSEDTERFYLGFWIHEGQLFIDVAEHIMNKYEAMTEGVMRNQIAIFDCANKKDIILPTTEDFIRTYVDNNIY